MRSIGPTANASTTFLNFQGCAAVLGRSERALRDMLCVVRRLLIALAIIFVAEPVRPLERFSVHNLVFLTRDGCVNTARMRSSLNQALKSLALATNYELIDVDKLEPSDRRRGYGTPTVLYKSRDLFGKAEPPAQHGAPS